MILNGPENSIKGHVFDPNKPDSLPRYVRVMPSVDDQMREIKVLNNRYQIVETCEACGSVLIAEEALAHKMDHAPSRIRAMVRTLIATPPEDRQQIIEWVNKLESN